MVPILLRCAAHDDVMLVFAIVHQSEVKPLLLEGWKVMRWVFSVDEESVLPFEEIQLRAK